MVREQTVGFGELVRVELLERRADDAVQVAPSLLEEARVRGFLHQAVAEAVLGRRAPPFLDDEVESLQLGERRPEPVRRDEPLEERQAEAAADDRRDRRHVAHVRCEAVEACLQRLLNRRRNGAAVSSLDRVAGRLLDEERVPSRALRELRGHVCGKLASCGRRRQSRSVGRRERFERQLAEAVAVAPPRRLAEAPRRQ